VQSSKCQDTYVLSWNMWDTYALCWNNVSTRAPLAWRKKATVRQSNTNTHRCSPLILIRIDAVPTILRTPRLFVEINIWWLPIVINSVGYGPWFGASEEIALPLPNTSRLVMWGSHGPFWWYGFGQLLSWRRSWSWEWRVAHTNTPGCSPYSKVSTKYTGRWNREESSCTLALLSIHSRLAI